MDKKLKHTIILLCCVCIAAYITAALFSENMVARAASPLWDGSVASGFAGGTGTADDPFLISDGSQLAYLAQSVNNGNNYAGQYIKLTDDILLNEMNDDGTFVSASPKIFPGIGNGPVNCFQGYFDGDDKAIIGLYIYKQSWIHYGGLFGYAAAGSVIRDVNISGEVNGGHETGAVAGYTNGVVTGCVINCPVTGAESYIGGVAGYAGINSEISNCIVSKDVYARYYAGGVAGWTDGKITECEINCTVTAGENYAGGIAGFSAGANSKISDCVVSGVVKGRYYAGGVAGRTEGEITGCSFNGTVTAKENYAGGVAGYAAEQSLVRDCSAAGGVSGRYYVGGVAGRTDRIVTGCSSECTVTGHENYVGGVVGYAAADSEVSQSSATGAVSGRYFIGGIAGSTYGVITVCINSGPVSGIEQYIGGVAGYAGRSNTVSNCANSGPVDGFANVGGIVGAGNWADEGSSINNNLNTGAVTGDRDVGGIIGSTEAPLDESDAWNNYYINAPSGTGIGDIPERDGAVPVGELTWEEIVELLNSDNPAGDDVWSKDENGIPVPGLFVPVNAVEVLNTKIKEGRYYTVTQVGAGTSAVVTADSVFTVVFSMRYNDLYHLNTQLLGLADEDGAVVPLPANTSIIMLVDGEYYYKNISAEAGARIPLGEFIKMGSATEYYAPLEPAPAGTTKEYLFIFDFSKTASGVVTGSLNVELLSAAATAAGTMPSLTVAGQNTYMLTADGANGQPTVHLAGTLVDAYDYKTAGKSYIYELQLEQGGVTAAWPVGTRINGSAVFTDQPYAFAAASFGDTIIDIDMSDCVNPLAPGTYNMQIKAYACGDGEAPRAGYMLASGATTLEVGAPVQYGIRASAADRIFDSSGSAIPVIFDIETLGTGAVKSTLQRKYGRSYVNVAGQTDLPVDISGGHATLTIPAGYQKGTYRFVFTLYDDDNTPRAQDTVSLIIK